MATAQHNSVKSTMFHFEIHCSDSNSGRIVNHFNCENVIALKLTNKPVCIMTLRILSPNFSGTRKVTFVLTSFCRENILPIKINCMMNSYVWICSRIIESLLKINCGRERTHLNHCWTFYRYSFGLIFFNLFVVVIVFHFVLVCHCATWMVEASTHVFVWWNGCVVLLLFFYQCSLFILSTNSSIQTDAQNRIRQQREKKNTPNWTTEEETSKTIQWVHPWDSSKWNYTKKTKKRELEVWMHMCGGTAELSILCDCYANRRDTW